MAAVKIIEILKAVRAELQLSQGDLAEKTGIARTYISRVENHKLDPRLSTLEKIASKGLGTSLDEIIHAYRTQHNGARPLPKVLAPLSKRVRTSAKTLAQIEKLLAQLKKEARP